MSSTLDTSLMELELTIRSSNLIDDLGLETIGDLLQKTSAMDLLLARHAAPWIAHELTEQLTEAGVDADTLEAWRKSPPKREIPPYKDAYEWGLLFTPAPDHAVRDAVRAAYLGAALLERRDNKPSLYGRTYDGIEQVDETTLGADHLFVHEVGSASFLNEDPEAPTHTLTRVLSRRYERTPWDRNPLAIALSSSLDAPVYAFLQFEGRGQLTAYEQGKATRTIRSDDAATATAKLELAELAPSLDMPGLQQNLPGFLVLLGIPSFGHHEAIEENCCIDVYDEDVDEEPLFYFVAPGTPEESDDEDESEDGGDEGED